MPLSALPVQDMDLGEHGALFHSRGLPDPAQSRGLLCIPAWGLICNLAGPPASLNTGLERPEHVWASECKQAVKYFKTWYFTRNGPSERPKIHSPVFALKRVGAQPQARWPGLPYINKGKENSLAVSGAT